MLTICEKHVIFISRFSPSRIASFCLTRVGGVHRLSSFWWTNKSETLWGVCWCPIRESRNYIDEITEKRFRLLDREPSVRQRAECREPIVPNLTKSWSYTDMIMEGFHKFQYFKQLYTIISLIISLKLIGGLVPPDV